MWRFAYRVALALGYFNVEQMLEEAPPQQLEKWFYYYMKEPFGDEWDRASLIATEITNNFMLLLSAFKEGNEQPPYLERDHFVPFRHDPDNPMPQVGGREIDVNSPAALAFFSRFTQGG